MDQAQIYLNVSKENICDVFLGLLGHTVSNVITLLLFQV